MGTAQNTAISGPTAPENSPAPLCSFGAESLGLAADLAKFISENKLSTELQGKKFVNVEGWQYAGSRLGIVPIVETVSDCSTATELKYSARVSLFDLGRQCTVGGGFAICSNKEGSRGQNNEFAIASMAQTRAIGKAYRNLLAWVIRAAGYEALPAEEMDYTKPAAAPVAPVAPVAAAVVAPNAPPGARAQIRAPAPDELPWLTDPTTPTPVLKAPVLLPVVAPAAQPPVPPVMVASSTGAPRPGTAAAAVAGRTQRLQAAGVLLSTGRQHELIGLLLQSPAITNQQRSTTLLNFLRFTHDRAQTSIGRLVAAIKQAGGELPENLLRMKAAIEAEYEQLQVPGSRAAAEAQLRFFVNTHAEPLGKIEAARLLAICVNPDYTAAQLATELSDGRAYIADLSTAAA